MAQHYRVCNLCEAMCGLIVETEDQSVVSIRANPDDVFSQGAYCPKSQGLKDLYEDSDRIKKPLKKGKNGFEEITWDQAFLEISDRIKIIQANHGKNAIATYLGNPVSHNMGAMIAYPMLSRILKTRNKYSATSVDQLPHMLAANLMFGHSLLLAIPDVERTDYMLILGANPSVSNGSLMSAAGISSKLKAIVKRGGKVVVIDPRYTETASHATEHHFIQPGTDVFLLAAIASILLEKGKGEWRPHTRDWETLTELLGGFDLELAVKKTGISRDVIEGIAKDFLSHDRGICYGRMGLSTQEHGSLCQWLINVINILSGNFDQPGGVLFTSPAVDVLSFIGGRGHKNRSRVRQLPDFDGEYPSATLADEILTPGEGQVKALITVAGNPAMSLPNGTKLRKALNELDLLVCLDLFVTETTSQADYILPPVSPLQRSHYDLIFNQLAIKNVARFSPAIFKRKKGELEDFDILLELAMRLTKGSKLDIIKSKATLKVMKTLGPKLILDILLRKGPRKQSVKSLLANPHGIDFGFLESSSALKKLRTKDKKIHLVPELFKAGFEKLMKDSLSEEQTSKRLKLIGRRNLRTNNSWMHNCKGLHIKKRSFYFQIHPHDAEAYGVKDGQQVTLRNDVGEINGPVKISDRIAPGVVSVPHGWGHNNPENRLPHAAKLAGASVNDIMDDGAVDDISGNAILNGQSVELVLGQTS